MNMPPNKYLCSIPILEDSQADNQTAADLAKAEEAKELARASERGWELLKPLDGQCLHHIDGWWSYRFCYGQDIVQYHALPHIPNGRPPIQDPDTVAYVLGRVPGSESEKKSKSKKQQQQQQQQQQQDATANTNAQGSSAQPPNAELQVKGDQKYLVQKMGAGTICDLTGRERTIEVQYHCAPSMTSERIAWVKEVTTCAYLMLVNTPLLCSDVAFLPPQESTANPITCRPILTLEDIDSYSPKAVDAMTNAHLEGPKGSILGSNPLHHPPVVGGIIVGGHNILASDGEGVSSVSLEVPRSFASGRRKGKRQVDILASRTSVEEGSKYSGLTEEELKAMDIDPSLVEDMRKELQKLAGDRAWRLEVVQVAGGDREIRGIVDVDEEEDGKDGEGAEKAEGGDDGTEEEFIFEEEL